MDEVTYKYECLRPSLETTYGVLVYQEQIMQIVRDIAGFTLQEADALRKAAGKKLPEEMAKVKKLFLDGCAKLGIVKPEEAEEIFEWIEKSQRYLFVKAHGVAYAILGYKTAYLKAHYPLEFYTGWLRHAHEKMDPLLEKAELVSDAKMAGIEVCVPDIRDLKSTFYIKDEKIYFGLGNVKSVGESQTKKIEAALQDCNLNNTTWYEFLKSYSSKINKTAIVNLISVGAFDFMGQSRNEMIYQYEIFNKLTDKEQQWLSKECEKTLRDGLERLGRPKAEGGGCSNKNRVAEVQDLVKVVLNPPYSLSDTPGWIAEKEKNLLGISITFHSVDDCDTETANCTCKDFLEGYNGNSINIAVELNRVAEYVTTKGKNPGQLMSFLTGSDSTGQLDSITCFPAEYATFKELLVEGNTVLLSGSRSKQNSLVVKVVTQL
jgi:DNA polymerase-3 subunit alpha